MKLSIIYEDDQILVIDKAAGIVVTPADTIQDVTISDILINEYKINLDRGGVVHRLDKDTSGVLIIAKTQKALENLQNQFKERIVKKEYWALVHGDMSDAKNVKGAIARNPANREKFIVLDDFGKEAVPAGRQAETDFSPLKHLTMSEEKVNEIFTGFNKIQMRKIYSSKYEIFTLVSAKPATGRTHQIRVHLKYTGFPLVSDEKYGGRKTVRLDRRWCPRQFLHARRLEIVHPETGKRVEFLSELPDDLKNALNNLNET